MHVKKLKTIKLVITKTKLNLYKQLVLPLIEYPPFPTHVKSKIRHESLQSIQKRALRQAYNDTSYPPKIHY